MRQRIGTAFVQVMAYLKQCWIIIYLTLKNKLQWNFNQNTKLFIHENASENIVCGMTAILSSRDALYYVREFCPMLPPISIMFRSHRSRHSGNGQCAWDKVVGILQTTFSTVFSWIKLLYSVESFTEYKGPIGNETINGSGNGLAPLTHICTT